MRFEEYLLGQNEKPLLDLIRHWKPGHSEIDIPEIFHEKLMFHVRDFSLVGGMPEAINRFSRNRDFLGCGSVQRAILDTYRNDFAKFRKRIPLERIEKVFTAVPGQVGNKWVHSRVSTHEKAHAIEVALEALCKAKVAHQVFHSSSNGVPLSAEQKDNLYKVLFIDVGLMGAQFGLQITDLVDSFSFERVNEGALAEQWVGQHLLDLRMSSRMPQLHYWVREKAGSMAEVDYIIEYGAQVIPVEVKAGSSVRAKSLQVFLSEKKKSQVGVHLSKNPAKYDQNRRILELPFYLVEQIPRILNQI
jgi:predicted AAA+ superfamily ATPase